MTILVTGSTGVIGSQVVANLAEKGAEVHALTRSPEKTKFPRGVTPVKGDLMDIDATQAAIAKTNTLFLLNAVTPDEVTQALLTLSFAQEAGVKRIVYFSVFHSDVFTDVPHFAGKYTVERMIEDCDLPVTVLRPNYFIQNDTSMKDALLGQGIYPQPIGSKGISMVDTRDIGEAALCPCSKEKMPPSLCRARRLNWSVPTLSPAKRSRRQIRYGCGDLEAFDKLFGSFAPHWMARDMRLMMSRFQRQGMVANRERSPDWPTSWATRPAPIAISRPRRRNSGRPNTRLTFVSGHWPTLSDDRQGLNRVDGNRPDRATSGLVG